MRLRSIDIAKGIGILAIVLGHLGIRTASGQEILEPWVFAFHVPIFFIVAGYFASNKRPFKTFLLQKTHRLLLPYVVTCIFMLCLVLILLALRGNAWPSRFNDIQSFLLAAFYGTGSWYVHTLFGATPIGAIWFLMALFFASLMHRFALKFRHGWLFNLLWTTIALITSRYFWLPFSLQSAAVGALFMSFGTWLRKRDFISFVWRSKFLVNILFMICLALYIVTGICNLKISVSSLLTATFPWIAIPAACISCVLVLIISVWIDRYCDPVAKFFEFFGRSSLVVLCVHLVLQTFALSILLSTIFGLSGNLLTFVDFALQLLIFTGCIVLFQRIKPLRWIFY